jgi:uncharacterized damage-inducible protein DinB
LFVVISQIADHTSRDWTGGELIVDRIVYDWVRQTRGVLFDFCNELDPKDFTCELSGFGWGSVRKTFVHIADCYNAWLGAFVLGKSDSPFTPEEELARLDIPGIRRKFEAVDALVDDLYEQWGNGMLQPLHRTIPWREKETLTASPLQLLMHTITHEFHHKGQIVSMTRHMGYLPPDTDLLITCE